ncbi:hypothetical protein GGR57DRAFT_1525 [Xylariaceae sp. FL1272]|nr:hypothetical protein GGR57DRAFT_1525 [Xylariaceae sp. FL1272]
MAEAIAVPNRGRELLVIDLVLLFITATIVITRCFVRVFMVKRFGADDWTMLFATVFFILYSSSSVSGVHYGTGRHRADLAPADYAQAKEFWWFCYLTYSWSMLMSKLSIGLFLLRVAVQRIHIWIIYSNMVTTIITCLAFFFVTIFQCHPVSYWWDDYTQSGTCIDSKVVIALAYLYSVCAIITDFTFALLPAWIIWGLQMKTRTKLALIPLMAMGCVASAAVIVRCFFLPRIQDPDFLWATTDVAIWSSVEEALAISAGSLATLRPLVKIIGYKLGMTTRPSDPDYPTYKRYGTSGKFPGGRRGSQSAVDALKMDTFNHFTAIKTQDDKYDNAYEVKIHAGSNGQTRDAPAKGGISMGRTYEVSSEYVGTTDNENKSPPLTRGGAPSNRHRSNDAESIEILQPSSSREGTLGGRPTVPRSFLVTDSE